MSALADPGRRAQPARALARHLRADDLLVFVADREAGLLPALGFLQALPRADVWRTFVAETVTQGRHTGQLPYPDADTHASASGIATPSGSTALILLGGESSAFDLEEAGFLLPLLTAAFARERSVLAARAEDGAVSHDEATTNSCVEQLDAARRELHQALCARDEFLSVAAHELKTPLTSLRGYAQMVTRQLDQGGAVDLPLMRHALQIIDRQAARLAGLVSRLLDLSRIEAGTLQPDCRPMDLTLLVEDVAAVSQTQSSQHSVAVETAPHIWVMGDALQLEHVLVGLIDNAIKYSPDGGQIKVRLWVPAPETAQLEIQDHGLGVPPERREHLFERRGRPEPGDQLAGMGLGLPAGRRIAKLHGGDLEADFPADGGTRLVLSLPTIPNEDEPPVERHVSPAGRVLIVDDDGTIRDIVSMALSADGYEVMAASNGRDALALIDQTELSLILLDMRMPVMDGWAFARAYHDRPGTHAPILAFTAARDVADRAEQIGAAGYLAKPFDLDELLALVGEHAAH